MPGVRALVLLLACAAQLSECLSIGATQAAAPRVAASVRRAPVVVAEVADISSTEEFEKALDAAGDSLVVVDYSTSWCGPCKIIAPKFDAFSEQYSSVSFLKV